MFTVEVSPAVTNELVRSLFEVQLRFIALLGELERDAFPDNISRVLIDEDEESGRLAAVVYLFELRARYTLRYTSGTEGNVLIEAFQETS